MRRAPALGAGSRRFESCHPDHQTVFLCGEAVGCRVKALTLNYPSSILGTASNIRSGVVVGLPAQTLNLCYPSSILGPGTMPHISQSPRHEQRIWHQSKIWEKVLAERARQQELWGDQKHHVDYWNGIIAEEVGETHKAAIERKHYEFETEAIQAIACIVSMLECFYMNEMGECLPSCLCRSTFGPV